MELPFLRRLTRVGSTTRNKKITKTEKPPLERDICRGRKQQHTACARRYQRTSGRPRSCQPHCESAVAPETFAYRALGTVLCSDTKKRLGKRHAFLHDLTGRTASALAQLGTVPSGGDRGHGRARCPRPEGRPHPVPGGDFSAGPAPAASRGAFPRPAAAGRNRGPRTGSWRDAGYAGPRALPARRRRSPVGSGRPPARPGSPQSGGGTGRALSAGAGRRPASSPDPVGSHRNGQAGWLDRPVRSQWGSRSARQGRPRRRGRQLRRAEASSVAGSAAAEGRPEPSGRPSPASAAYAGGGGEQRGAAHGRGAAAPPARGHA